MQEKESVNKSKIMGCNISAIGTCVTRDIFGMHENDGGYIVDKFMQDINPISAISDMMLKRNIPDEVLYEILNDKKKFYNKIIKIDLQKELFMYMFDVHSNYLLLDSGACRRKILKWIGEGKTKYQTIIFPDKASIMVNRGYLPSDTTSIDIDEIDEVEFNRCMDLYVNNILKVYKQEEIILVEFYESLYYVNKMKVGVFDYNTVKRENSNILRGFNALKRRLPNSHVIEFPGGVIGNSNHKWGKLSLHYVDEYYDYALEAVNIITDQSRMEKRKNLLELKTVYEEKMKEKYEHIFVSGIKYLQDRDSLCTRMKIYEEYVKDLLLNKDKLEQIRKFFYERNYHHVAFYGFTEICKVLIHFCKEWGIEIDYIIEDINLKKYENISIIGRQVEVYPNTQIIIISDMISTQNIKDKLSKRNISYLYVDAMEILSSKDSMSVIGEN